ncbi:sarcocystatin-A [Drosophila sechellia]|uniref:GM11662 n=1 Tax=Drosophila sechellia TaxID=7238 RepID=B4INM8_DROSE|nr:sarcocystatin-A [Drosophila sechellia]EDW51230.1 GM11662 [Drosophila sechellia]
MFLAKILILCTACVLVSASWAEFGAPRNLEGQDLANAQQRLEASLTKLAAGDGPHYRLSKVLSATSQVVSGVRNDYSVELIDNQGATKVCHVDIWSKPWLPGGIQVTFNCPNEPELVRRHDA